MKHLGIIVGVCALVAGMEAVPAFADSTAGSSTSEMETTTTHTPDMNTGATGSDANEMSGSGTTSTTVIHKKSHRHVKRSAPPESGDMGTGTETKAGGGAGEGGSTGSSGAGGTGPQSGSSGSSSGDTY